MLAATKQIEFDGVLNAKLEAAVDVFLPVMLAEVGLALGEDERVYAAV